MLGLLKKIFGSGVDFKKLIAEGAIIVDVRTPAEYQSGHIEGSVNIPLDSIKHKIAELKQKNKTVITCCRSGARSGMAKSILRNGGIEAHNGGAWNVLRQHAKG
jgi:rhodanese-related sulfurtransferase